jgi:hypothetical protein
LVLSEVRSPGDTEGCDVSEANGAVAFLKNIQLSASQCQMHASASILIR